MDINEKSRRNYYHWNGNEHNIIGITYWDIYLHGD
jgi:hypothetical protein